MEDHSQKETESKAQCPSSGQRVEVTESESIAAKTTRVDGRV